MDDRFFVKYSPLTTIDYPGKLACIGFTGKCNMRCPYCHNLKTFESMEPEDINEFIEHVCERSNIIKGIVVSGGESLMPEYISALLSFLTSMKLIGFDIKIDTNGTHPIQLQKLAGLKLIDYVAMDVKSDVEFFPWINDKKRKTDNFFKYFNINKEKSTKIETFMIIIENNLDYELRTTMVKPFINHDGIIKIASLLKTLTYGKIKRWYLQRPTLDKNIILNPKVEMEAFSEEELEKIKGELENYVNVVEIR